jgi:two-component system, NarL family, nitrate/nitrite response regulator NarL
MKIRLFLVDDHPLVIEGIKTLLSVDADLEVVGTSCRPTEVIGLLQKKEVDVLIVDVNMPELNGLELSKLVVKAYPHIKILALSVYSVGHTVKDMMEVGIKGYLLKSASQQQLLNAIHTVAQGKKYLVDEVLDNMLGAIQEQNERPQNQLLTERELEILRLIEKEFNNKRIAETLFISERTVETHRKNIFRKTQTDSLIGLVKFAYLHKLI